MYEGWFPRRDPTEPHDPIAATCAGRTNGLSVAGTEETET